MFLLGFQNHPFGGDFAGPSTENVVNFCVSTHWLTVAKNHGPRTYCGGRGSVKGIAKDSWPDIDLVHFNG